MMKTLKSIKNWIDNNDSPKLDQIYSNQNYKIGKKKKIMEDLQKEEKKGMQRIKLNVA